MTTRSRLSVALLVVGVLTLTVSGCGKKASPTAAGDVPSAATSSTATDVPATPATAAPSRSAAGSAIDGRWKGTYTSTSTPGSDGTFEVTYATSASGELSGSIQIHNTPCVSTGTVNGRLNGTAITFGAVQGAQTITFTGTFSNTSMSGSYDAPACGHGKGTWSATRA